MAAQYGAWPDTVAKQTNTSFSAARGIHYTHHHLFHRYWDYVDRLRVEAQVSGVMLIRGGWKLRTRYQDEGTLGNFPVQAHRGEIMRLAASQMVGDGLRLCTTVHDAVLIEDSTENIHASVVTAKAWWRAASREIIGYELDADAKVVRYPDRFEDKYGRPMFELLMSLLEAAERERKIEGAVSLPSSELKYAN